MRIGVMFGVLGLFALGACKQDLGERCQLCTDCYSGYCELGGNTAAMGGVCDAPPAGYMCGVDSGVTNDLASRDLSMRD